MDNKINVLQLCTDGYLPDFISGNPFVVKRFNDMFMENGMTASVVLDNKINQPIYRLHEGVDVFSIPCGDKLIPISIEHIIKAKNINVILYHGPNDYYRFINIIGDEKYKDILKIRVNHYYDRNIKLGVFDAIITFQKTHYDKYKEFISEDKLILTPHTIKKDEMYEDKTIPRKPRSILYTGRVIREKGVHRIIPYLEMLNATYTIVGPTDIEYKNKILEYMDKYNMSPETVTFIDTVTDRSRLRELYNSHELFFLGSESDCYSLVLTEALACGMQALVSHIKDSFDWTEWNIEVFYDELEIKPLAEKLLNGDIRYDTAEFMKKRFEHDMITDRFIKDFNKIFIDKTQ